MIYANDEFLSYSLCFYAPKKWSQTMIELGGAKWRQCLFLVYNVCMCLYLNYILHVHDGLKTSILSLGKGRGHNPKY